MDQHMSTQPQQQQPQHHQPQEVFSPAASAAVPAPQQLQNGGPTTAAPSSLPSMPLLVSCASFCMRPCMFSTALRVLVGFGALGKSLRKSKAGFHQIGCLELQGKAAL